MNPIKLQNMLIYLAVAISIGAVVCTLCLFINYGANEILIQLAVWLAASAIIGVASLVYENENLTDLTATLIHAPITIVVALIAGWIIGYGDGSFSLLLARMLPSVIIIYIAIHLFLFFIRRSIVRSLNKQLNK